MNINRINCNIMNFTWQVVYSYRSGRSLFSLLKASTQSERRCESVQSMEPKQGGFKQVLGLKQVLAIAIAAISPTTSVFLVYGAGLSSAGTGVFWAFVIGACIAISMAFCYAELGSVVP